MSDCCNDKACDIEALRHRQSATLKAVLVINAVMFVVELTAGLLSGSLSLLATSSFASVGQYVVTRGARMKATAALFKGSIMAAFGIFVLGQAIYKLYFPQVPVFETIGAIGLLALAANSLCLLLLWRHRSDDINMQSVWLCSRNDIVANV